MLRVGDSITDHVLEEDLENTAGLLVDETGDTLDTTTAGETADGGLGDALDVVAKDLPVALGASLAEALASLSTSRHSFTIGFRRIPNDFKATQAAYLNSVVTSNPDLFVISHPLYFMRMRSGSHALLS